MPLTFEPEFSQISDWHRKTKNHKIFQFRLFPAKSNDKKNFKAQFGTIFSNIPSLPKNCAVLLLSHNDFLTSRKISRKTRKPFPRKLCYGGNDEQTEPNS